jgi:Tfp pilus assembly protein FimT
MVQYKVITVLQSVTATTNLFQQSMPLRHKEVHLINVPSAVRYFYDLISSLLSEKMKGRIRVCNTSN